MKDCVLYKCNLYSCSQLVKPLLYYLHPSLLFFRPLLKFITTLYKLYTDLYFTYLEINPLGKLTSHKLLWWLVHLSLATFHLIIVSFMILKYSQI